VGEKMPHALALQEADHLTPALLLSLLTTAVRLVGGVPATIDVGAAGLNATEMTGGGAGGVLDPPPHPVIQIVVAANAKSEVDLIVMVAGGLIGHLPARKSPEGSLRNAIQWRRQWMGWATEQEHRLRRQYR
jgi:hypothetical protein